MKRFLLIGLAVMTLLGGAAIAQKGPSSASSKASKSRGSGPDTNIKMERADNSGKRMMKPARKGGKRTRGAAETTYLHIDNRTGYYVDIYVDGANVGTVSPYGDSYGYVHSGSDSLYAKAPGTDLHFGPRSAYLAPGGTFTWTLTE